MRNTGAAVGLLMVGFVGGFKVAEFSNLTAGVGDMIYQLRRPKIVELPAVFRTEGNRLVYPSEVVFENVAVYMEDRRLVIDPEIPDAILHILGDVEMRGVWVTDEPAND